MSRKKIKLGTSDSWVQEASVTSPAPFELHTGNVHTDPQTGLRSILQLPLNPNQHMSMHLQTQAVRPTLFFCYSMILPAPRVDVQGPPHTSFPLYQHHHLTPGAHWDALSSPRLHFSSAPISWLCFGEEGFNSWWQQGLIAAMRYQENIRLSTGNPLGIYLPYKTQVLRSSMKLKLTL